MSTTDYVIKPIGVVCSKLTDRETAPKQGSEGAPDAWIEIHPAVSEGLEGITVGSEIILITWFHLGRRDILKLHPKGDKTRPITGVFSTRSPDRPNPLGLHLVTVFEIETGRMKVGPLEAIDGTPIVDIKPVLSDLPFESKISGKSRRPKPCDRE